MTTINDIIGRLEKATGPDRELDREIKIDVASIMFAAGATKSDVVSCVGGDLFDDPRPYTTSIDAALTLVPEGWRWWISDRAPAPHKGRAYLNNGEMPFTGMAARPNPNFKAAEVTAPTPSLALCIASLKARTQSP